MNCAEIREHLHEAQDGPAGGPLQDAIRDHLVECASCREFADDLNALSRGLRALPRAPLPEETLDTVWRLTIDAGATTATGVRGIWRLAAAAVFVTAASATTLYFLWPPAPPRPTPSAVELARAEAQAELVFGYTARALAATRTAATDRVLASKVSPALRQATAQRAPRRPS
jgi:predicted anti-sigma-YlaC factor YlaD